MNWQPCLQSIQPKIGSHYDDIRSQTSSRSSRCMKLVNESRMHGSQSTTLWKMALNWLPIHGKYSCRKTPKAILKLRRNPYSPSETQHVFRDPRLRLYIANQNHSRPINRNGPDGYKQNLRVTCP
ncbi:hypothetical protein VNO77_37674 [Canavalia gladiata]|uniref:Uncharacterized protein n=1 Tax=Canavalia gladiata TaxID=3824 RepID=A0AAN9KAS1_CANGL